MAGDAIKPIKAEGIYPEVIPEKHNSSCRNDNGRNHSGYGLSHAPNMPAPGRGRQRSVNRNEVKLTHYLLTGSLRPMKHLRIWQSRAEILKSHLDSLDPSELIDVRPDYYALRFGFGAASRSQSKYDPNQPRDDHGRWVDAGGGYPTNQITPNPQTDSPILSDAMPDPIRPGAQFAENEVPVTKPAPYRLATNGKQSASYCWNQMQIDMLYCSTRPRLRIAPCRSQAMERYAACIAGKPLPPLPF